MSCNPSTPSISHTIPLRHHSLAFLSASSGRSDPQSRMSKRYKADVHRAEHWREHRLCIPPFPTSATMHGRLRLHEEPQERLLEPDWISVCKIVLRGTIAPLLDSSPQDKPQR